MTFKQFLQSSADPNALSLTIKGFLVGLIPVFIFLGSLKGLPLTESGLIELIDLITKFVAGVAVLIGLGRKIYYWFKGF